MREGCPYDSVIAAAAGLLNLISLIHILLL
jgi:hypothetical protein